MSFARFCADLASERLRTVAAHWSAAKGDRRMPAWGNIDPVMLGSQLPIVWSWRYDAASDRFVGRLAGEEINQVLGRSLRGAPMEAVFIGSQYERLFEKYKRIVSGPSVMRQRGCVFRLAGRLGFGEKILLPLSADGVRVDGVFGAAAYRPWSNGSAEHALNGEGIAEELVFQTLD
ncbi:MAG: hypothetical protein JWO51_2124 [Rhodospirillales bacterium]|nr:hypothetical protein [Rhodospirillales bacterium]